MYIKLDTYFYIETFDLETNVTEILKYILPLFEKKQGQRRGTN